MGARTRPHTRSLFEVIDAMDVTTLASLFAEDGQVVFGNGQPWLGIDKIRAGMAAFFETIAGLHHEVVQEWNVGDDAIIELKITYHRKDGQQVPIPCVTIFHTDAAGTIDAYRVHLDVAPFMADCAAQI
jgi:ketosteroid isomerase-like protein